MQTGYRLYKQADFALCFFDYMCTLIQVKFQTFCMWSYSLIALKIVKLKDASEYLSCSIGSHLWIALNVYSVIDTFIHFSNSIQEVTLQDTLKSCKLLRIHLVT